MKSTIRGNRYDTERAEAIHTYSYGSGQGHLVETLYRTPRGLYFVHGKGGPASRWASRQGPLWAAGERLTPLAGTAEAAAWLAAHGAKGVAKRLGKKSTSTA